MISDVLFEAVQEIERYQRELPNAYEKHRVTYATRFRIHLARHCERSRLGSVLSGMP